MFKDLKPDDLRKQLIPWTDADDPALDLTLRELDWYAQVRKQSRRHYHATEGLLLLVGAATTVAAALAAPPVFTACLAALTVFLTGYRQTFDPHGRWIACALAWNQTRDAIWQYKFSDATESDKARLVARMGSISDEESSRWLEPPSRRGDRESMRRTDEANLARDMLMGGRSRMAHHPLVGRFDEDPTADVLTVAGLTSDWARGAVATR